MTNSKKSVIIILKTMKKTVTERVVTREKASWLGALFDEFSANTALELRIERIFRLDIAELFCVSEIKE